MAWRSTWRGARVANGGAGETGRGGTRGGPVDVAREEGGFLRGNALGDGPVPLLLVRTQRRWRRGVARGRGRRVIGITGLGLQ